MQRTDTGETISAEKAARYTKAKVFRSIIASIAEDRRRRRERGELPPLPQEKEEKNDKHIATA